MNWCKFVMKKKENELHEWKELLDYELRGMNEYHRTALLLRVQKDLSYAEISSIMKVSEKKGEDMDLQSKKFFKTISR